MLNKPCFPLHLHISRGIPSFWHPSSLSKNLVTFPFSQFSRWLTPFAKGVSSNYEKACSSCLSQLSNQDSYCELASLLLKRTIHRGFTVPSISFSVASLQKMVLSPFHPTTTFFPKTITTKKFYLLLPLPFLITKQL